VEGGGDGEQQHRVAARDEGHHQQVYNRAWKTVNSGESNQPN